MYLEERLEKIEAQLGEILHLLQTAQEPAPEQLESPFEPDEEIVDLPEEKPKPQPKRPKASKPRKPLRKSPPKRARTTRTERTRNHGSESQSNRS